MSKGLALSQDSYIASYGDSEQQGPAAASVQRRDTLASFNEYRKKRDEASRQRKAQSSEPQMSHLRWRRKEHIYESIDDILEDLRQTDVNVASQIQDKTAFKRISSSSGKDVSESSSQKEGHNQGRVQAKEYLAPSPAIQSPRTSPTRNQNGSPSRELQFSSLQSADSGYMSNEQLPLSKLPNPLKTSSAPTSVNQIGKYKLGPTVPSSSIAQQQPAKGKSGRELHRRQGSSPANLSINFTQCTSPKSSEYKGTLVGPVKADHSQIKFSSLKSAKSKTKSDSLSKSTSKKSSVSPKVKNKKSSKSPASGIGFLSSINKISGTESVSDFDFHPTPKPEARPSQLTHQAKAPRVLTQPSSSKTSLSQPNTSSQEPVSYIGLVGSDYDRYQRARMAHQQQQGATHNHQYRQQSPKSSYPNGNTNHTKPHANGLEDTRSPEFIGKQMAMRLTLSQPSQEETDDSTLVLHKPRKVSSSEDPAVVLMRKTNKVKTSHCIPANVGNHHHSRPQQPRAMLPPYPVAEETWC